MRDPSSILLAHEAAYCLGQRGRPAALPSLVAILEDRNCDPIVRHEAAEAIGAIGNVEDLTALASLRSHTTAEHPIEVVESCELALARLAWLAGDRSCGLENPAFESVDPAAPSPIHDLHELRETLLDRGISLVDRYRALFALRNANTVEAVHAICAGFGTGSALFEHELAYVLGQIAHPASAACLIGVFSDRTRHDMVLHEAAEALGAIATDEAVEALRDAMGNDNDSKLVRESVLIALDLAADRRAGHG